VTRRAEHRCQLEENIKMDLGEIAFDDVNMNLGP
jgi:hypothetical protein